MFNNDNENAIIEVIGYNKKTFDDCVSGVDRKATVRWSWNIVTITRTITRITITITCTQYLQCFS